MRKIVKIEPPAADIKHTAFWMIGDLAGCMVKILGAVYGASLVLAADALFGLTAWYYALAGGNGTRRHPAAVIPVGLILASAATGIVWKGLNELLAGYQGLLVAGPKPVGLLIAVCVLVARDFLRRAAPRVVGSPARQTRTGGNSFLRTLFLILPSWF